MAFKDLSRRTASDKTFNIAKNSKYDSHQKVIVVMVYNFLIKSLLVVLLKVKLCQTNI